MSAEQQSSEQQKYELALKLENEKWKYKKEELQYLEAGQHLRSLNQLLWQVPGLAIAITGGLWFGVTSLSDEFTKQIIFGFTAAVDFLTVITLHRLREVIQLQIDIQNNFSSYMRSEAGQSKNKDLPNRTVIKCWTTALMGAAVISIFAIFTPPSFTKTDKEVLKCCECCPKESSNKAETNNAESEKKLTSDNAALPTKTDSLEQDKKKTPQVKKHITKTKTICKT